MMDRTPFRQNSGDLGSHIVSRRVWIYAETFLRLCEYAVALVQSVGSLCVRVCVHRRESIMVLKTETIISLTS